MPIVTFWNDSREQSGKTLTAAAVATKMAIERNSKILLISTSIADPTLKNCFWGNEKTKNANMFTRGSDVAVESGMEGLLKLVTSNKLTSSIITDYTKVVFKGRLEVILGPSGSAARSLQGNIEDSKKFESYYAELIKTANQYYDIVIVDLDKMLNPKTKEDILKMSEVNVYVFSQNLESIRKYGELKNTQGESLKFKCVPVIGKYINKCKYNSKNIARYLGDKREPDVVPLNLLYMEAANEGKIIDLFLMPKNTKDVMDENYIFMQSVMNLTNNIFKKLQDMQMRMR